MSKKRKLSKVAQPEPQLPGYDQVLVSLVERLESARRAAARSVNAIMTATYWAVGQRIVEFEQGGEERSRYGSNLLRRLSGDLTKKIGRGFSVDNLESMRRFYLAYPPTRISETVSRKSAPASIRQTVSNESSPGGVSQRGAGKPDVDSADLTCRFPLPWSHYVLLLKVDKPEAREFYEVEALRNGWTVRQLDRQIHTLFYERTLASRNKVAMLKKGGIPKPGEELSPEEEIKDPLLLEFLGLKDEYSESELEEALIRELESFLLELGGDFTFVGRQRRLRIDDEWYRIDLLFFHRKLRCLVVIDLKLDKLTHADIGQMHLYLNYARENWTNEGENPPVGIILCTKKGEAIAHNALEGLLNKVLAAEYRTTLPDEETLAAELDAKRRMLEFRAKSRKGSRK